MKIKLISQLQPLTSSLVFFVFFLFFFSSCRQILGRRKDSQTGNWTALVVVEVAAVPLSIEQSDDSF